MHKYRSYCTDNLNYEEGVWRTLYDSPPTAWLTFKIEKLIDIFAYLPYNYLDRYKMGIFQL